MDKRKSRAFNKDVYLLGKNKDGELLWIESPSWDCGWYWGFGYVETYTINEYPNKSRVNSHSHFDGLVWHTDDNNKYVYHINEELEETTLTDNEAWQLSDLMKRFYILRESAAIFGRGTAHFTSNTSHNSKNEDMAKYINEVELPKIFNAVIALLDPNN